MSSLGLRMDDEPVRIAVGLQLGTHLCTLHQCVLCGDHVESSSTHGLHCRRSVSHHPKHTHLNDFMKSPLPLSMCHRYWKHQAFVGWMAKGWMGCLSPHDNLAVHGVSPVVTLCTNQHHTCCYRRWFGR